MQIIKKAMMTPNTALIQAELNILNRLLLHIFQRSMLNNFFIDDLEIFIDRFLDPDTDLLGLAYFAGKKS